MSEPGEGNIWSSPAGQEGGGGGAHPQPQQIQSSAENVLVRWRERTGKMENEGPVGEDWGLKMGLRDRVTLLTYCKHVSPQGRHSWRSCAV